MIITVATTQGPVTVDDAEAMTVGGLKGVFAVHARILEVRNCDSLFDNWVVTHIPTGCAFVRAMTKKEAMEKAEEVFGDLGPEKFAQVVAKWGVIVSALRTKQASLFEEQSS